MFQINADFLINQLKNIFMPKTLQPSFIFKKVALSIAKYLETFTFYHTFTNFDSGWSV